MLKSGNHSAWVHDSCKVDDEELQAWSMKRSKFMNPNLCTVIIMDDISKMDDATKICVGLSGLWVMSKVFFSSQGHRGTVLAHKANFKMKKQCMMTAAFREKHTRITGLVEAAKRVGKPLCNTKICPPDMEDGLVQRALRDKRNSAQYIFLIATEERSRFKGCNNVFNVSKLVGWCSETLTDRLSCTGNGCN